MDQQAGDWGKSGLSEREICLIIIDTFRIQVYLDSNIVFAALDMKESAFTRPATELLKLLKDFRFDVRVFAATVSEICNLLSGFGRAYSKYPVNVHVDSIYRSLKAKGWKSSDVQEFIIDIEGRLAAHGIKVDNGLAIDLLKYKLQNADWLSALARYKPDQHPAGQTHDLAVIERIMQLRKSPVRILEQSRAIFLTSDLRLSRYNFLEMNHKQNGTICEVIPDRLLTNILWLKRPNLEIPLASIISAYSRELFVDRQVWDRFYSVLKDLKKSKRTTDESIAMLFYHDEINKELRSIRASDLSKVTPSYVLGLIEDARKSVDMKLQRSLSKQESEFVENLDKEVARTKQITGAEWLQRLESIKARIRKSSSTDAAATIRRIRFGTVAALFVGFAATFYSGGFVWLDKVMNIAGVIALLVTMAGPESLHWSALHRRLEDRTFARRIKDIEIPSLPEGAS